MGKSKRIYTKLNVKAWYIFLLCIIILLVPIVINHFSVKGYEPYLYMRLSNIVGEDFDALSYGGRGFAYNYGNPILLNLLNFMPLGIVVLILPVILGVLSLILFYYILKEIGFYHDETVISSLVLMISPPFLYAFSNFNYFTVPLFLVLLGFYFFIKDNTKYYILSLFISFLLVFFGFFNSIIYLLIVLIYCIKKEKLSRYLVFFICNLVFIITLNFFIITHYGLPNKISLGGSILKDIIFDLGGGYGISLFLIFLIFFGFSKLWEKKYQNSIYYTIFIIFIGLLFFSSKTIVYFNLFLCVLATLGFFKIWMRNWQSINIRNLTLLFLICGLIFTFISFYAEFSKVGPSENEINALTYLNEYGTSKEVVLSHYSYGFWINYFANKKNVVDGYFDYAPKVDERIKDEDHLFNTRSMDNALEILTKYKINYILITKKMKEGLVWYEDNDGLLFLINNNPKYFDRVYNKGDIEIWKVKQ